MKKRKTRKNKLSIFERLFGNYTVDPKVITEETFKDKLDSFYKDRNDKK